MNDVIYQWNEKADNYCLWKDEKFITPLKPLKLSEVAKESLAECLQSIYFKRTGETNSLIGLGYEKDVALAKEMNCWD